MKMNLWDRSATILPDILAGFIHTGRQVKTSIGNDRGGRIDMHIWDRKLNMLCMSSVVSR